MRTSWQCLRSAAVAFAVPIAAGILPAAQLASPQQFEVASVRRGSGNGPPQARTTPNALIMMNATLKMLVQGAFDLPGYRVTGWPSWLYDKFDIDARAPEGRTFTHDQLMSMLQSLLIDRFQLQFHHQTREMNVLSLVVAKNGSLMREYQAGDPGLDEFRTRDGEKGEGIHGHPARPTRLVGQGATMPALADMLTRIMGQTVLDRTRLTGKYDFDFEWSPESTYQIPAESDPSDKPSIFTAIRQLGLRLQSGKGPVDVFVIDHVERPSEN